VGLKEAFMPNPVTLFNISFPTVFTVKANQIHFSQTMGGPFGAVFFEYTSLSSFFLFHLQVRAIRLPLSR